jgi:hypothetical protein
MANVLQVNKLDTNRIETVMTPAQISQHTIDRVLKLTSNVAGKTRIVIGLDDNGEQPSLAALITMMNAGAYVIFTHGNPSRTIEMVEGETHEEYEVRQAAYLATLASDFGIDGFADPFTYQFYTHVHRKNTGGLAPLTEADVQSTHSTGMKLSAACTIYYEDPLVASGPTNWYLSQYNRPAGGRVYCWNAGHCEYGHADITGFTAPEKQLLILALG